MNKVLVYGPGSYEYNLMFQNNGYRPVANDAMADFVCFTGGEDVDPSLYGEPLLDETTSSPQRDAEDIFMYHVFRDRPKVGICRGGQLLNVLNGGKMWQDVDGHATGKPHPVFDVQSGREILCTSTHHQMMRPGPTAELLAYARESTRKKAWNDAWIKADYVADDAEVLYYPATQSLCFQPHPEFLSAPKECTAYFFELLKRSL